MHLKLFGIVKLGQFSLLWGHMGAQTNEWCTL